MAASGTITGTITTNNRHWKITITGVTSSSNSQLFVGKGYSNSSFVVVGGLGGATVQFQGSNDDGTTWVNIGTAIGSTPAGGTLTPNGVNYGHYQMLVIGGGGATSVTAYADFASQNAS